MSSELLISAAGLVVVTIILCAIGLAAQRVGLRAISYWQFAWASNMAAAAIVMISFEHPRALPPVYVFSSVMAPLMLLGAFAHVDRQAPPWIVPYALLSISARVAAYEFFGPGAPHVLAAVLEPPLALYGAFVVSHRKPGEKAAAGRTLLGVGFGLYGIAELADAVLRFTDLSNWAVWGAWLTLGVPLIASQLTLFVRQLGARAIRDDDATFTHEERLRALTEANDAIVVEYDEFGTLTYTSGSAKFIDSGDPSVGVGRNAGDYFAAAEDSPIKRALAEKGRITEADVSEATVTPHKATLLDGRVLYYEANRATYRTAGGELRILSQARNVTNRMLREESIRESERRLRRAEQAGNFGSWEHVAATDEVYWSDHLYRMHGLEPKTGPVDRDHFDETIEREDLERLFELAGQHTSDMAFPEIEYRIRRADTGETRLLRTSLEYDYDENGELVRTTGASRDITEQKELENRLRRGREYLDTLVDSNIVGVFYANLAGEIYEANDSFLSLTGYTRDDLPIDWREITPPELHDRDQKAMGSLARTGTAPPYEKEFLTKSGGRVVVLIGSARIEETSALAIVVDMSERKRAEAYIAAQQRKLEDTIEERTKELLESRSQLHEAERLATVGTLAAGVAHQINNPIGAILTSSEYALLCGGDEEALEVFRGALETNLSEAKRCARIVKSMLQFSRDQPTEKWVEDLNRIALRAHRAIAAYAIDRKAQVDVRTSDQPILVCVSPIEIEQAIVNILRNATESRSYGANVLLALSRRGDWAEIEITDDGRGISEADRDHLFDPFFSTRTRDGGTGLGLSVAHGIAKDHGGEIRVDSGDPEGTRVLISLPIVENPLESSAD